MKPPLYPILSSKIIRLIETNYFLGPKTINKRSWCHNATSADRKSMILRNLAVLSKDALSSWLPSRENTTLVTPLECACSRRRKHWPVLRRQTWRDVKDYITKVKKDKKKKRQISKSSNHLNQHIYFWRSIKDVKELHQFIINECRLITTLHPKK